MTRVMRGRFKNRVRYQVWELCEEPRCLYLVGGRQLAIRLAQAVWEREGARLQVKAVRDKGGSSVIAEYGMAAHQAGVGA